MSNKRFLLRTLAFFLVFSGLSLAALPIQAQTDSESTCPMLVQQALTQLGGNCTGLERNSVCYGYNRVQASFDQAVPEGFFTRPSDRSTLATIKTIQTTPLDLLSAEWGIAVMNVQANVPDTLPGQAVTFLLLGDTQVENAVPPSMVDNGPATSILQSATDMYTEPITNAAVMGQVAPGTVLQFESVSADGAWLRVTTGLGTGWINRDAVNQTIAVNNLPVEGSELLSPMQAFYFRNGISDVSCQEAPSVLAVRSPENITVDLTVNGADIRLGSLITLQTLPGNVMRLTTIEGTAIIDPEGNTPLNIPAGFTTTHCLAPEENLGSDGEENDQELGTDCTWEEPEESTLEEIGEGLIIQTMLQELGLEEDEQAPEPTAVPIVECPLGTTIVHTISPGENLYRIGLRYRTGMGAIMAANGLANPQIIYSGQQLIIPCGVDTGLPSIPPPPVTPDPGSVPEGVNCAVFRATSPLDGLPYGSTTFYWDAAPGTTGYRVNIYNLDEEAGALVASFDASAESTNLTADLSIDTIGYGFSFAWEVQALLNGQVVCSSIRHTVPREARPADQPPPSSGSTPLTASWSCGSGTLLVTYAGIPATDTSVVISFTDSMAGPSGGTFIVPPTGGTQIFSGVFTVSAGSVTSFPSGSSSGALTPASMPC